MDWTLLTDEPRAITGPYGGVPSLERFALDSLMLSAGDVLLRGDLLRLPDPMPARWVERGCTRACLELRLTEVVECELRGVPGVHFDAAHCLEGDPVKLAVEASDTFWTAPDGRERPWVVLTCEASFLDFRMVGRSLGATLDGYQAAPY